MENEIATKNFVEFEKKTAGGPGSFIAAHDLLKSTLGRAFGHRV